MSLGRVLLDCAVFIYAVGADHPFQRPSRLFVAAAGDAELDAHTTVLVVQEVLHQRARRTGDRDGAANVARDVASICQVHDVTVSDLGAALDLYRTVRSSMPPMPCTRRSRCASASTP